jgi:hypothetical protein
MTVVRFQWTLEFLSLEIKWLGCENDRSLPPSADVKAAWSYTFTPYMSSWHGANRYIFSAWYLVKHRDN